MLLQSGTWRPMLKIVFAHVGRRLGAPDLRRRSRSCRFSAALGDDRSRFAPLRPPGALGTLIGILGGVFGAFLAGYTGVLLSVTNRPIWADTNLLGLVFLVSAASTSAALLILLGGGSGPVGGVRALARFDSWVLVLELVVLAATCPLARLGGRRLA